MFLIALEFMQFETERKFFTLVDLLISEPDFKVGIKR